MNNTTFAKFATITNLLAEIACINTPVTSLGVELDCITHRLTTYKNACVLHIEYNAEFNSKMKEFIKTADISKSPSDLYNTFLENEMQSWDENQLKWYEEVFKPHEGITRAEFKFHEDFEVEKGEKLTTQLAEKLGRYPDKSELEDYKLRVELRASLNRTPTIEEYNDYCEYNSRIDDMYDN